MKAAVLYGLDDIQFNDFEEPVIEGAHDVKINVKACGICRSDVPRVLNGTARYYPIILGHEFSGIVTQVGADVTDFKPGDHVAGIPLIPCFECEDCQSGNYALCKNYSFIGSRQQGAYGEYVVVPDKNVIKIDSGVPFEQAALIETSTVALHAFCIADYDSAKAKAVAIVGVGTIGLFAVQWARILGADKIAVFGRSDKMLSLAKELGATDTFNTTTDGYMDSAMELTGGRGFDYIFESAGSPPTIAMSYKLAANKATVALIGTPTDDVTFTWQDWELINRKEFKLIGSWMSYSTPWPGKEWQMTVDALKNGDLRYDERMLFGKFDLSEAREAFDSYKNGKVRGRILLTNDR